MRKSRKDQFNKNNIRPKKKTNGLRNRTVGNNYERALAKLFREEFGFLHCKTSRAASKMLDDSKVDLAFTGQWGVQAKFGYKMNRPKADEIFREMKALLLKNYPEEAFERTLKPILFHRLDKDNEFVTIKAEDFKLIFKGYLHWEQINKTLKNE